MFENFSIIISSEITICFASFGVGKNYAINYLT